MILSVAGFDERFHRVQLLGVLIIRFMGVMGGRAVNRRSGNTAISGSIALATPSVTLAAFAAGSPSAR